ncbi:MAG: hypothetical protein H7A00_00545 [Hahellaceae bacterium]|nr:hypothetical protein [Hahellaceae bacterium]
MDTHAQQTVAAAQIASELHQAQQVAKQLAISSKNARAIVLRAGSKAAGLAVIANFYDELANKTIFLAQAINLTALNISNHSVIEWRNSNALENLEKAFLLSEPDSHRDGITHFIDKLELHKRDLDHHFNRLMNELYNKLDEIQQHMRAIDVIAVTSKLEAVQTGDFRGHLVEMAEGIQMMANKIKEHVSHSISLLDQAR